MTDKEIIKALDDRMYCGKWIGKGFLDKKDFQILKNALDLINRQQAEIERLNYIILRCKNEEVCKKIAEHLQMCDTGKKYAEGFADGFKATHEKNKRIKAIFKGGV
jgi:Fe-S oxidoreductase